MTDPYLLYLQGEASPMRVIAYRALERLSAPYRFEIRCLRKDASQLAASVLGRAATFVIQGEDGPLRRVHGIVTGSHLEGHGELGSGMTVVLEPRIARMRWRRRRRIFQNQPALTIAANVIEEHGGRVRIASGGRTYEVPPYLVQLDESDLDFVLRILAEVGVFTFFEQPEGYALGSDLPPVEVVVLGDVASIYPRAPQPANLHHRGGVEEAALDGIFEPRLLRSVATESVSLRGLDFERPRMDLADRAPVAPPSERDAAVLVPLERHTHELSYETVPSEPGPATMELEQERRDVVRLEARTRARHLAPGEVFSLVEAMEAELCGDYAIVELEHEGRDATRAGRPAEWLFDARFAAVPSTTPYRPARTPKPTCHGVETATVVGPIGEVIHTDEHGRIRVHFPWDGSNPPGDHATTWLRVAQGWAGTGFGMQFIPRVGSEVLVAFVGGDPDRPIVVGGLYDAVRPYPNVVPQKKTLSTIRTASVGAGGSNEISFEDAAGKEVLTLRGQRNLWLEAGADHFLQAEGSETITVGGGSSRTIGGDETLSVGGSRKVTVTGAATEETAAASITRHGNDSRVVDGSEHTSIAGSSETRVGKSFQLTVGTAGMSYANIVVQGTASLRSHNRMFIGSKQEIIMEVGESSLVVSPEKIVMRTPEFQVTAPSIKLYGKDAAEYVEIGEGVRIKSDVVTANGASSSLNLDAEAKLSGAAVKLGAAVTPKDASDATSEETSSVTFKIENLDPSQPTTAHVLTPSGRVEQFPVPASGVLQIDGKPGERFSLVDLRVGSKSVTKTRA